MNENDKLFSLIKSLTKNEKGYFKKYASFHTVGEVNNYVLLFDLITKQEVYNEQKIKKLLEKKINQKNFRESKRYLYEMILSSLELYHSEISVKTTLKKQIHRVEILFGKALYEQCEKILDNAEKIAECFEKWDILIELNEWRTRMMAIRSFEGVNEIDIITLYEKSKNAIKKSKNETDYQHLNISFFYKLRQTRYARNKEEKKLNESIVNNPLLKNANNAYSIRAKQFFFGTLGAYYYVTQNFEKSLFYYTEEFNLLEKKTELIADNFGPYQSGLYNLINATLRLGKHEEAFSLLTKLEELKTKTLHQEVRNFVFTHLRKIELFLNTAQFEKVVSLNPSIDEGIKKYDQKINISHRYHFDFNIGCAYLILGTNKDSLLRFNKIINNPQPNLLDIQSFARILSLIAHYELKNQDQLPYAIRSTYRFLMKKKRVFEFENVLIRFINKLQHITINKIELKKVLSSFLNDITKLSADPNESKVFEYFDFISWLESKIQNRLMIEILREKAISNNKYVNPHLIKLILPFLLILSRLMVVACIL